MGLFDNVTAAVNRGTAAAERAARKVKLQAQLGDVNKRRQGLAAQLGASLYEATRENEVFRAGRETLYDGIASCDAERDGLQAQIAQIEAEAAAEAAAAHSFTCGVCGARVSEADLFCSGCGTPAAEAKAAVQRAEEPASAPAEEAPAGPVCPSCGATVAEGDLFCMGCGACLGGEPEEDTAECAAVVADDAPAAEGAAVSKDAADTDERKGE